MLFFFALSLSPFVSYARTTIYLLIFIIVFVSHFKNIFHFSNYAMWSHKMSCLLHFHSRAIGLLVVSFLSNRCCLRIVLWHYEFSVSECKNYGFFIHCSLSISLHHLALGFTTFECCCCCCCLHSSFWNETSEFETQKVSFSICKCAWKWDRGEETKRICYNIRSGCWETSWNECLCLFHRKSLIDTFRVVCAWYMIYLRVQLTHIEQENKNW